jgi:hypothetical protein
MSSGNKKKRSGVVDDRRRYTWRAASRFTKLDPQSVGEELERIRASHGVHVTAEQIVEAAGDPLNPLHEAFPWDDAQAAHEHRLEVARSLLRSVRIVIITPERKEIVVPLFVSTPRDQSNGRHYTTTEYAMGDPELRAHVLRQAFSEFAALRRKYAELSELAIIFSAIDSTRKKVS